MRNLVLKLKNRLLKRRLREVKPITKLSPKQMTRRLRNGGVPTPCRSKIRKLLQLQSTPERKADADSLLPQKMSPLSEVAETMGDKRRDKRRG